MQSLERHYPPSSRKKQFKKYSPAGKVMITVLWDSEEVIIADMTPRRKTVNSDTFIRSWYNSGKLFRRVHSRKNQTEILLHHDNARLYTHLKTQEAITKVCCTVLSHLLNSPDLAPSDFHLFGALKDGIHGMAFETDGDMIRTVRTWLREQDKAWCRQSICRLVASWRKGVEVDRLHRKIVYGVIPSLFIMCNFHDLGLGIYWEKKK